jgi:hypothetical protein
VGFGGEGSLPGGASFGDGQVAATLGASAVATLSAIMTLPKQKNPRGGGTSPQGRQITLGGAGGGAGT